MAKKETRCIWTSWWIDSLAADVPVRDMPESVVRVHRDGLDRD